MFKAGSGSKKKKLTDTEFYGGFPRVLDQISKTYWTVFFRIVFGFFGRYWIYLLALSINF